MLFFIILTRAQQTLRSISVSALINQSLELTSLWPLELRESAGRSVKSLTKHSAHRDRRAECNLLHVDTDPWRWPVQDYDAGLLHRGLSEPQDVSCTDTVPANQAHPTYRRHARPNEDIGHFLSEVRDTFAALESKALTQLWHESGVLHIFHI